jgi:hypothetical protein
MAWQYFAYKVSELPTYTAPEGTQIGDLERMIYDCEYKYARCQLAIIQADADPRLDAAAKTRARTTQEAQMGALEQQKTPLLNTLAALKSSGTLELPAP